MGEDAPLVLLRWSGPAHPIHVIISHSVRCVYTSSEHFRAQIRSETITCIHVIL